MEIIIKNIIFFPARQVFFFALLVFSAAFFATPAFAEDEGPGINERLGQTIDPNIILFDENGDSVMFGDLVDKPLILAFVYYNCPGICTPLLNGLLKVVDQVDRVPGEDYKIITVSINEDDTPKVAQQKKSNHLAQLQQDFPPDQWHWLTGDSAGISKITQSAGFGFQRTGDDFAHGAALITVSGELKIARYLYGISFNPFDLKLALIEASENRFGPSIAKVIKFCFSYDPEGRSYVFNVTRISGIGILLTLIAFALYLRKTSVKTQS